MEKKSRTSMSIKNIYFTLFFQFTTIVLNYVCRYVFVKTLTSEYLGVNGLFSNILTIFSLTELGIGSAIVFAMYKPIAKKNIKKIQAYMNFYKKCYMVIAVIVFILGMILLPNINFFINGETTISNLKLIYFLYLIDSVSSYFFVYKSSILNAMQENYICNIYQTIGKVIMSFLMILSLVLFKNFIIYLIIQIAFKLVINLLISKKADKMYPYIKEKNENKLTKYESKNIFKNVYALFCNQIGNVLILGTDNIIISKYINLTAAGLYSNYYLITNSLSNIIGQIFNAIVASVGNLAAEKDNDYTYEIFKKIHFFNFILAIFCVTVLSCVLQDFIKFSFGKELLLSSAICIIIIANFYLLIVKNVVGTFKYALGIFWNDKYCTLIRAIINVVVSIILAKKIGLIGVFIGTLISDILTTFWYQPYILYKSGFNKKSYLYFIDFFKYLLLSVVSIGISLMCTNMLKTEILFFNILIELLAGMLVPLIIIIIFFRKNEYFLFLIDFIKKYLKIKK